MIELSTQPQLFLDDHLIAKSRGLARILEQPVKHPANPLLVGAHPWEARAVQCYGNVLFDAERDCFRFWYFEFERSALVPVDALCCRVRWGERSLAEAPRGSSLAFRIGRGARLYGFQMSAE